MVFRFCFALALVVGVSLAGVVLERETLERERNRVRQMARLEELKEEAARLRLEIAERSGAPPEVQP